MNRNNLLKSIFWPISFALLLVLGSVLPAHAETSPNDYKLGKGDRISIQVFDEVDLTMSALVGGSGIINYSYLGILQVAGKTPAQLENEITKLLKDGYLVNPSVNVTIESFRPFYIGGEVSRPGSYPYQLGLTVEKAIALAGGLTDRASTRKIFSSQGSRRERDGSKGRSGYTGWARRCHKH